MSKLFNYRQVVVSQIHKVVRWHRQLICSNIVSLTYVTFTAHACGCRQVILNQREGKFGLKTGVEGSRVLVTGVSRRGAAGRAGLRPGDQLITINGRTLTGLRSSEVQRIFRDCPPVGIKFTFRTRYQVIVKSTQYSGFWVVVVRLAAGVRQGRPLDCTRPFCLKMYAQNRGHRTLSVALKAHV